MNAPPTDCAACRGDHPIPEPLKVVVVEPAPIPLYALSRGSPDPRTTEGTRTTVPDGIDVRVAGITRSPNH